MTLCKEARKAASVFLIGTSLVIPRLAKAEYRLAPGDVIELGVAGASGLRQRTRVDADGEISIPLIGQVRASGRLLSEVRAEVQALLPTKTLRRDMPQGHDIVVINPEEITLEVAEYRPVYVSGDVARPGEQPYRLGMTVRQAVAVSGDYDLLRFRADQNPIMQSADLRSEYQTLWTEYVRVQVQTQRVNTELKTKPNLNDGMDELRALPIEPSVFDQILRFEGENLATNEMTFEREKDALTQQIRNSDEQIALVQEQLDKTKEGMELAMEALLRVRSSYERGVLPVTRVAEEQRFTLIAQTQNLQTTERFKEVQKERQELARRLNELEVKRRVSLSGELQDAVMKLSSLKSRLASVEEKLTFSGLLRSQLTRGKGASPEIVVVRKSDSGYQRIVAQEDTELLPGDTVEVSLRSQVGLAAAER